MSHDQLAQRISEGAKWADIGREAGVRSTYAQAVWASIQNRYPGVKYAHGKGRGRNGHSVTDDDRNTVVLFRQGHITRAQAYERLTACGRTRGGAKQILNKHSHSIPQASEQQQSSHQLQIPRPRTYSNASSTTSSVYDQNNLLYTPSTNYSSSPESSPEPMTPNDKSSVSLPISSLLLPSTSNSSNNTSLPSNDPPRLRSLNTSQHQRPQTTPLLGLGLNVQKPPNAFVSSYDQSSPIRLPPISSERKQIWNLKYVYNK